MLQKPARLRAALDAGLARVGPLDRETRARRLRELARWLERRSQYLPTTWVCHELGISRSALSHAKGRARGQVTGRRIVRTETIRFADGYSVECVNIDDVARLKPRGGVLARREPVEPPPRHPQEIGPTMTAGDMIRAGDTDRPREYFDAVSVQFKPWDPAKPAPQASPAPAPAAPAKPAGGRRKPAKGETRPKTPPKARTRQTGSNGSRRGSGAGGANRTRTRTVPRAGQRSSSRQRQRSRARRSS